MLVKNGSIFFYQNLYQKYLKFWSKTKILIKNFDSKWKPCSKINITSLIRQRRIKFCFRLFCFRILINNRNTVHDPKVFFGFFNIMVPNKSKNREFAQSDKHFFITLWGHALYNICNLLNCNFNQNNRVLVKIAVKTRNFLIYWNTKYLTNHTSHGLNVLLLCNGGIMKEDNIRICLP